MLMLVSSPPFISWYRFLDSISTEERHRLQHLERQWLRSRPLPENDPVERDYSESLTGYDAGASLTGS